MPSKKPPRRLPEGFREIREALARADRAAPSRRSLARRLGVTTQTLQRILVSGDVPRLKGNPNVRIVRSWARILTRLAYHLGYDPKRWIRRAGIRWDDTNRRASETTLRRLQGLESGGMLAREPRRPARPELATRPPDHVTVGLARRAPFSDAPDSGASFLMAYVRRLVGALNPRARLESKVMEPQELSAEISKARTPVRLSAGVLRTTPRMARGMGFVDIPGIRVEARAARLTRGSHDDERARQWGEVLASRDTVFAVSHDVAHDYLVGQCAVDPAIILGPRPPGVLLRDACARVDEGLDVVVVGDDLTAWGEALTSRQDLRLAEIPGGSDLPTYALAVGLREPGWHDLMERAGRDELFGATYRQTARLYARLVAAHVTLSPEARAVACTWSICTFDGESAAFRHAFAGFLVDELAEAAAGSAGSKLLATVDAAGGMLPTSWVEPFHQAVDVLLSRRGSERMLLPGGYVPFCHSCSTPLSEPANRGLSHRFCRYCSDSEGNLKPRVEVQRVIAEWMEKWQGGISREQALARAGSFMRGLPAWSEN